MISMSRERRTFDPSFKKKAVELSIARGRTKEVADELGIEPHLIYRWKKEYDQYEKNSFPGRGKAKMTDEEKEIARLRAELKDTRLERDILKKAISIFSVSDKKSSGL